MTNDLNDYKDPIKLLQDLKTRSENYWINRGEIKALNLFKKMSTRVPAYKDFLKKNKIDPNKIKSIKDFKYIPLITKDNYLKAYPLEKLCWDGKFKEKSWVFATTSGSTGEPYYFPREEEQDLQYALSAEMYLRSNFEIHKKSTLYINGFAMGAWIGGLFTYQAIKHIIDRKDYQISIINPGIFKEEIIKAVKNLGDKFDQIIIGGYPPMIKATIDEGIDNGLDWKKYNLGFIFSAESFSEEFRDYIIKKTSLKNSYKDTLNHYGTVDLGTMSHETPLSILIRRIARKNSQINIDLFGEEYRQPTLTQFLPELFFFEEVNQGLVCSASSGIPLVRYDLKDAGAILSLDTMKQKLASYKIDIKQEMSNLALFDTIWNLPFVYVFERKDFIVKLYGANIYPDTIRRAINIDSFEDYLTGKFVMIVKNDNKQNQFLEINIELQKNMNSSSNLKNKIQKVIIAQLLKENSEYRSNYKGVPKKQIPKIILWEYEHQLHFSNKGKQKWVK